MVDSNTWVQHQIIQNTITEKLPIWVQNIHSDNPLYSLIRIRQLSSIENAPISAIIRNNVVPQIVKLLKDNNGKYETLCRGFIRQLQSQHTMFIPVDIIKLCVIHCVDDKLQSECIWILTNITSEKNVQTAKVVENGAISVLVDSFWFSSSHEVQSNAIWALGNITANCRKFRNEALDNGIMTHLFNKLSETVDIKNEDEIGFLRIVAWTLENLCSGKQHKEKYIILQLKTLCIMLSYDDTEILQHATCALMRLTFVSNKKIGYFFETSGLFERLISLLDVCVDYDIQQYILEVIGNIINDIGMDAKIHNMIKIDLVKKLSVFTLHNQKSIKRKAKGIISNITGNFNI
eukprot:356360_1